MTVDELLRKMKNFGEHTWDEEGGVLHYYAVKALEDLSPEYRQLEMDSE